MHGGAVCDEELQAAGLGPQDLAAVQSAGGQAGELLEDVLAQNGQEGTAGRRLRS